MKEHEPLREIRNRLVHGVETELDAVLASLASESLVLTRHSPELRQCPVCSFFFVPARSNQAYCRPACKQAAYQLRQDGQQYVVDVKMEPFRAGPLGLIEIVQRLPPKLRGGSRVFLNFAIIRVRVWAEDEFDAPGAAVAALAHASSGLVGVGTTLTAGKIVVEAEQERRASQSFYQGQAVTHLNFGRGVVVKSHRTRTDEELIVRFDKGGIKILSASVAPMVGHAEMDPPKQSPSTDDREDTLEEIEPGREYPT